MNETGILTEVTETEEASNLISDVTAGGLLLPLANADDFTEPGLCEVNGETYVYTEVTADDELVLDPSTPLLTNLSADDEVTVYSLSDTGTRDIVRYAWVRLDEEGDAVPAVIPTGMRGYFRVGDAEQGSLVEVRSVGDDYAVASRPVDNDALEIGSLTVLESAHVQTDLTVEGSISAPSHPGILRFKPVGGTQTMSNGAFEAVSFASSGNAPGGITATSSSVFTLEESGSYLVTAQVTWTADPTGRRVLRIVRYGLFSSPSRDGEQARVEHAAYASSVSQQVSWVIEDGAPGDAISIETFQTSGAGLALISSAVGPRGTTQLSIRKLF